MLLGAYTLIKKPLTEEEQELRDLRMISYNPEDRPKVEDKLQKKSDEQLYDLLDHVINESPFSFKLVIEFIIQKLYSDDERFVDLLRKLIEKVSPDMGCGHIIAPIEDIALKHPDITISISNKMLKQGIRPGICSGFMISPLLGKGIVDEEILTHLRSDDSLLKRRALVGLCNSFIRKEEASAKMFIPTLLDIAKNIDDDDSDIIINTLIAASRLDQKSVIPIISEEINRRGYIAALVFARTNMYYPDTPMDMLKKSVSIIESESPENNIIDEVLGYIYEKEPGYVIERLRSRVNGSRYPLAHGMLEHFIRKNPNPIIQMFEEEMDNRNPSMLYHGASFIGDYLLLPNQWLEWCKKWKDDDKKEPVVLSLIAKILSNLLDNDPDGISNDAIALAKEFTEKKGFDYETETKGIKYEDDKDKEEIVKALRIINQIIYPPSTIDTDVLDEVLSNYPYVSKTFNTKWLIRSGKSRKPHLLSYIYSKKPDIEKMKQLLDQFNSEENVNKKIAIGLLYNSHLHLKLSQDYWEKVFETLDKGKIKIPSGKLKDVENASSILAEAEVIARLVPYFKIELEPDIEELRPKRLDALIDYNGEKALIEVASVSQKLEHQEAGTHKVISGMPGDKIKNVLLDKYQKQLKKGVNNPGLPIIIILDVGAFAGHVMDTENAIYGQFQFSYRMNTETNIVVEEGATRAFENSFYKFDENTNIVTSIGSYSRDYTKPDPLIGRLYPPLASIIPKNPMSRKFRIILRNALFGDSETSNWKSMMKVEDIDETLARKFYNNGIEDLGELASTTDEELIIDGVDLERMKIYQKEAKRIAAALHFGSIKYLRGIDQPTYDILTSKGIHLTENLLKIQKPTEIAQQIWDTMIQDAKRIYAKNTD